MGMCLACLNKCIEGGAISRVSNEKPDRVVRLLFAVTLTALTSGRSQLNKALFFIKTGICLGDFNNINRNASISSPILRGIVVNEGLEFSVANGG